MSSLTAGWAYGGRLELTRPACALVERFRERATREIVELDRPALDAADARLTNAMAGEVAAILDQDRLADLAHLINGWGDAIVDGAPLLSRLEAFVHRDADGRPRLLQGSSEGDKHPHQMFAYALMAGVEPRARLAGIGTLAALAANSRIIETADPAELGHLLYAASELGAETSTRFVVAGTACRLDRLVARAIRCHRAGPSRVCFGFHIVEGLCAIGAQRHLPIRDTAQRFVDRQLDVLVALGPIFDDRIAHDGAIGEIRRALAIHDVFENHVFVVGHAVELAMLASRFGYRISDTHANAAIVAVNAVSRLIPRLLPAIDLARRFLPFAHFRRAATLLAAWSRDRRGAAIGTRRALAGFAVSFDRAMARTPIGRVESPAHRYSVAPRQTPPSRELSNVLARYAAVAAPGLRARGGFPHFRRIIPPRWPRALHYELLDTGPTIGAELHVEDPSLRRLQPLLSRLARELGTARWDPHWFGTGRVRIVYARHARPGDIVQALLTLIAITRRPIENALGV